MEIVNLIITCTATIVAAMASALITGLVDLGMSAKTKDGQWQSIKVIIAGSLVVLFIALIVSGAFFLGNMAYNFFTKPSISIVTPTDGQSVPHGTIVSGTSKYVPGDWCLWLVTKSSDDNKWYIQNKIDINQKDGTWDSKIYVGNATGIETGKSYQIGIYKTDSSTSYIFQYLKGNGLLLPDSNFVDIVSITRE